MRSQPAVSPLKSLPPARQRALYEYMEGPGRRTAADCLRWLRSAGVEANRGELARWRSWYVQRLRFRWCWEITALMADDPRSAGRLFNVLLLTTCNDRAWKRRGSRASRDRAMGAIARKMEFALEKYDHQRGRASAADAR